MTQFDKQSQTNFKTGRDYHGANAELLTAHATANGYSSNEWATLKQWNSINETVRKREKGLKISFTDGKGNEVNAFLFNRHQLES